MHEGKSGIPADIVEAAEKAAASCWTGTSIRSRQGRDAIIKALLAEREKAVEAVRLAHKVEDLISEFDPQAAVECIGEWIGLWWHWRRHISSTEENLQHD